jgi:hypothetical protein
MSSDEPSSIKPISRHEYNPLIIILSLIGLFIIVVFIFLYHKRKYYLKKKAEEKFRENRKRKYIIEGSSLKADRVNHSSINLKILNENKINPDEKQRHIHEEKNSFNSEIKNLSTMGNKQDDLILKISVPNKFKEFKSKFSSYDRECKGKEYIKNKINLDSTDTNSSNNNTCKNLIKINNEKFIVKEIKICKFVNSPKLDDFSISRKHSIKSNKSNTKEKEIIFSENSLFKKSPRTENNLEKMSDSSNLANISINKNKQNYFSENPDLEKNEDFEKLNTIQLKESNLRIDSIE